MLCNLMPEDCDFELGIKLPVPVDCASKMITNPADAAATLALLMIPTLLLNVPLAFSMAAQLGSAHEWLLDNPNNSIRGTTRHL
jgi:hypothetical protein